MTDERRNAPSASGMPRYHACDASFAMQCEAERQNAVPDGMAGADSGQRIHGELHVPGSVDLNMSESDMAERCGSHMERILESWLEYGDGPKNSNPMILQFKETRIGLTALGTVLTVTPETKAKIIFSGQMDGIAIEHGADRALIWDHKTLMGEHEKAEGNLQLLSLAWLASKRWSLDGVRVALIQPWRGAPSVADYDRDALRAAGEYIAHRLAVITAPGAIDATSPSSACHYCPGRLICEHFQKQAFAPQASISPMTLPPEKTKEALFARVHEFDGHDLAALLDDPRMRYAAWLAEAAKGVAAKRLAAGESVPGWELRDVKGDREIKEPLKAWGALAPLLQNDQEAFLAACKPSAPGLEEMIRRKSGKKITASGAPHQTQFNLSGKKAKEELEKALGPLIFRKDRKQLARIGKEIEDDT